MRISTLDSFTGELEEIADASPEATFYHTRVWAQALSRAYPRMTFRCLLAEDAGQFAGYLPFFLVKKGPLLRAWSMPFGTYGGPVARGDERIHRVLLEAYRRELGRSNVVEVGWVDYNGTPATAESAEMSETHLVDLSGEFDAGYATQRRQRVRRSERLGVTVRRATSSGDLLTYYNIYRDKLTGWGTQPPHPQRMFEELFLHGGDTVRLYLAEHDGSVIGGHFNFYYGDAVIAWYNMTTAEGDKLQAGSLLYSVCMRDACDRGYHSYNLGGSLGKTSLIDFKESLGGVKHEYVTYRFRSPLGRLAAAVKKLGGGR